MTFLYLLVCWVVLNGPFVLDDKPNLNGLEDVHNWKDIWYYSLSGSASLTGRPLSYLSFALQAGSWPENPFPFKLLNLTIHLCNGLLCYISCYLVATHWRFAQKKCFLFAGVCAALWIFLPLHASTVFYVVQRMTLLAGFFTWLGILSFLLGVSLDVREGGARGRWVATIGIMVAYIFGILSKQNAVLVGVFIILVYCMIIRPGFRGDRRWWDYWVLIFGLVPIFMTVVYLGWGGRYLNSYNSRDYTLTQRVYSEWRILWEYLSKILAPSSSRINLMNDDFVASKDILNPITTLLSGLAWGSVIVFSWLARKYYPFLLFGTLWFLGGHLLESSFVGLELYFEHRNYMPSVGVIISIVWGSFTFWDKTNASDKKIRAKAGKYLITVFSSAYFLWSLAVLAAEAISWKDTRSFVSAGINERPESLRANQQLAGYVSTMGDYDKTASLLLRIEEKWPGYPATYASLLNLYCIDENVFKPSSQDVIERFKHGKFEYGVSPTLYAIYKLKSSGGCRHVTWGEYRFWLNAIMSNPNRPRYGLNDNLFRLKIFSYVEEGNISKANEMLADRDEKKMSISLLILKMETLYLGRQYKEVLSLIERVEHRYQEKRKLWTVNQHIFFDMKNRIKNEALRDEQDR